MLPMHVFFSCVAIQNGHSETKMAGPRLALKLELPGILSVNKSKVGLVLESVPICLSKGNDPINQSPDTERRKSEKKLCNTGPYLATNKATDTNPTK